MPKRHRTPAPETTFRPGPRDDISTKNPWKTRKNPAACGGRQNSTQGLLWEQMWTSTTGTPEAAEENFAPPPRGSLLVKFRQNRGAPLALCQITVEFRQIPAAAAAPVETVKPVKSRQNPDRSRPPTLLKPYPSCSHSRTGGRWGAVRWWIRPGLGSERESRRSNTREDIASIACSLQCTDPLRKQKVKLLCIINYVVLRRGRKEVSKFRETASMTAPAPLSVQLCLTPSRW